MRKVVAIPKLLLGIVSLGLSPIPSKDKNRRPWIAKKTNHEEVCSFQTSFYAPISRIKNVWINVSYLNLVSITSSFGLPYFQAFDKQTTRLKFKSTVLLYIPLNLTIYAIARRSILFKASSKIRIFFKFFSQQYLFQGCFQVYSKQSSCPDY